MPQTKAITGDCGMQKREPVNLLRAYSPVLGIFFGTVVGFALFMLLHHFYSHSELSFEDQILQDAAVRFDSMFLSVIFWSLGITVGQHKQIYGGGAWEMPLEGEEKDRHHTRAFYFFACAISLYLLATMMLIGHWYILFFMFALLPLAAYAGEIGFGSPLFLVRP